MYDHKTISDFISADDKSAKVIDLTTSISVSWLQLTLNVGAMLLVFVALISLLNGILEAWRYWRMD
ncbi:MAG: nucleoside transporter C-terminal domain-containing protein [Candidatus Malihini olakiniferum]